MHNYPKYSIHYPELNVTQRKNLIPHKLHEKGKLIFHQDPKKADKLRKAYYKQFGDYFTDQSPLYHAMQTQVLDCNPLYGIFQVIVKPI